MEERDENRSEGSGVGGEEKSLLTCDRGCILDLHRTTQDDFDQYS